MTHKGAVSLRGVVKRHGSTTVLHGVDLDIAAGDFFVLLGPSGSGKTTTLRILAGLEAVSAGCVTMDGEDVTNAEPGARDVAMVFQSYALYPHMNVYDNIAFNLRLAKFSRDEIDKRVKEAARILRLNELLSRSPAQLSGGQRQRVAIARALACEPKFIVCDEAISALDVSIQAQVINLLEDLQEKFSLTYMFIAHDLSVVEHISDRVAVMYLGLIVEIASSVDLYSNPLHPYTEALLSAVPIPDPTLKRQRIRLQGDVPSPINPPSGCHFHTRCPIRQLPLCSTESPPLKEGPAGHWVSCHFRGG